MPVEPSERGVDVQMAQMAFGIPSGVRCHLAIHEPLR
jgi:hypothetical protein